MKTIFDAVCGPVLLFLATFASAVILGALTSQYVKPVAVGTFTIQGTVLRAYQDTLRSCVELSKTTMEKSTSKTFCTFRDIRPALPEVGDKVKLIYRRSPYILMDTIELEGAL